ncbi:hypothetical protein FQR65_LT09600 [Abscondita terminalis]|nr:hypothetical protein FQR65_LT09600 [Abscondita terminalis]
MIPMLVLYKIQFYHLVKLQITINSISDTFGGYNFSSFFNEFLYKLGRLQHEWNSTDLHTLETFLNIYSGWEESKEFNMESLSQNCLNNIELRYIPYHLTHTYLVKWNEDGTVDKETVFVLSGSDNKVHVYQENRTNHMYKEVELAEHFPEFVKPASVVMWMDIYYFDNYSERLTVFGCECGYMRLCRYNLKSSKIMFNFSTNFNGTISNVRIYPEQRVYEQPKCMKEVYKEPTTENSDPNLNVIITNTLLPPVHFRDVLQFGLARYECLPRLDLSSVYSSIEIADINFDGFNEILIGTSHHEVIVYEFDNAQGWFISDVRHFAAPILGLKYVDITGDGVKELIVLTVRGVTILQYDQNFVFEILEEKLKMLTIPNIESLSIHD